MFTMRLVWINFTVLPYTPQYNTDRNVTVKFRFSDANIRGKLAEGACIESFFKIRHRI